MKRKNAVGSFAAECHSCSVRGSLSSEDVVRGLDQPAYVELEADKCFRGAR